MVEGAGNMLSLWGSRRWRRRCRSVKRGWAVRRREKGEEVLVLRFATLLPTVCLETMVVMSVRDITAGSSNIVPAAMLSW